MTFVPEVQKLSKGTIEANLSPFFELCLEDVTQKAWIGLCINLPENLPCSLPSKGKWKSLTPEKWRPRMHLETCLATTPLCPRKVKQRAGTASGGWLHIGAPPHELGIKGPWTSRESEVTRLRKVWDGLAGQDHPLCKKIH